MVLDVPGCFVPGSRFFCIVFFNREMESWATTINRNASWIMLLMGVFGAAVLGWHISLAKCLMHGLMKSKKLCSRGTNTFVLRQLWDRLGSNALMAGLLAVLLTFAVAGPIFPLPKKQAPRRLWTGPCLLIL